MMQYDLIYPEDENKAYEATCLISSAYFDQKELLKFGVDSDAYELDEAFIDYNEFAKVFKLWESPLYLSKFFKRYSDYFKQEYWDGITVEEFVNDVIKSLNSIKDNLQSLFKGNEFHRIVEPLSPEDKDKRLYQSIAVKVKQGEIKHRYAFRFYAIEIEEKKCYLITGATIKVHKDMLKAENTRIEMEKLEYALGELTENRVDTKELFIDFILN